MSSTPLNTQFEILKQKILLQSFNRYCIISLVEILHKTSEFFQKWWKLERDLFFSCFCSIFGTTVLRKSFICGTFSTWRFFPNSSVFLGNLAFCLYLRHMFIGCHQCQLSARNRRFRDSYSLFLLKKITKSNIKSILGILDLHGFLYQLSCNYVLPLLSGHSSKFKKNQQIIEFHRGLIY